MATLCPACQHDTISEIIPVQGRRYATCAACRSVYLNMPREPQQGQAIVGGKGAFRSGPALGDHQRTQIAAVLRQRRLADGRALVVEKAGRRAVLGMLELADVESGLRVVAAEGAETRLVDLPDAVVKLTRGKGPFATAIVAGAVERLAEPDALLGALSEAVRADGALVLVTPNAAFARLVLGMARRKSRQLDEALDEVLNPAARKLLCSVQGARSLLGRHGFSLDLVQPAAVTPLPGPGRAFQAVAHRVFQAIQAVRRDAVLSHYMVLVGGREG